MKNSKTGFWLIFSVKAAVIAAFLLCSSCNSKANATRSPYDVISFEAMNTFMNIKAYGNNASSSNKKAKEAILKLEKSISVTDSESEVYKINNSSESDFVVSDDVAELLTFAIQAARNTDGVFNPFLYPVTKEWGFTTKNYHVPEAEKIAELLRLTDFRKAVFSDNHLKRDAGMQLDFGGIGKGYAGDIAIKALKENGVASAVLDLGGNVQALGSKPDGSDWNIGLKNPWESGSEPVMAVKIKDCAVITSGGYERYFTGDDGKEYVHIFDSSTGYPVDNELVSVTIVTKNGITGDVLSTSLFAMGKDKAIDFWKNSNSYDFDFILLCKDFSAIYSSGLSEKIKPLYDFSKIEICTK